jgi:23S rRNA pseudouridine1911/1915/1917 synthase
LGPEHADKRLDHVLAQLGTGLSRRELRNLFARGLVKVAGVTAAKGSLARPGSLLEVLEADRPAAPALELQIVRLERDWLVIEKPAGVPSAPLHSPEQGCIASALLDRFPEQRGIGYREQDAGLLSRLDTQTSGLLLAARTAEAFRLLHAGARDGRLQKEYLAFVAPNAALTPGLVIDQELGPHRSSRRRVGWGKDLAGRAVAARTQVIEVQPGLTATRVLLRVNTAYRHQIRAHLASLGCPLLGDRLYGGPPHVGLERHALHASALRWSGTPELAAWTVRSALPNDLAQLLG